MSSRISRSKSNASRTRPPRPNDGSQPDVQIAYTAAGQETLAAIAAELLPVLPRASRDSADESPEVSVAETPAGRETLALIAESVQPVRAEQTTLSYGDRISNAPGAKTPSRAPAPLHRVAGTPPQTSAPEISIAEGAVGRETLAVIAAELHASTRDLPAPPPSRPATAVPAPLPVALAKGPTIDESEAHFVIFEMLTFVVQGRQTASLSSEALRRRFVEEHLLHRLPAKTIDQVNRVEVTPWTTRGTLVVRVWCKL